MHPTTVRISLAAPSSTTASYPVRKFMKHLGDKLGKRTFTAARSIANNNGKDKEKTFIYNRLKQLAEDSTDVDASMPVDRDALPFDGSTLAAKFTDKLKQQEFDAKYQKEISFQKIPSYASKQARDVALGTHWQGSESVHDANLRMLVDVHKPLKPRTGLVKRRVAKVSVRDRLHNAREGSLDYSLSKLSEKKPADSKEDDGWSERYRERLLGVELFGPTSVSSTMHSVKAMVDRRIEEAKNRGEFDNLPNRGKPLQRDHHAQSAYIDTTEYHLNNILKRQDIVPPWIERQGSVQQAVEAFRRDLDNIWLKRAVIVIKERHSTLSTDELLQKAVRYAEAEAQAVQGERLRDAEWLDTQESYLQTKIAALNDTIRGYNLQAPLASQKVYLIKEPELAAMYKRSAPLLHDRLKVFLLGPAEPPVKHIRPGSYLGYNELPQREDQESLVSLFLNMFKRSS